MGCDGFWEKLRRMRLNWGLMGVEEGCGVVGDAVAAARAAPEVAVVMVEAAAEWVRELWSLEKMKWFLVVLDFV